LPEAVKRRSCRDANPEQTHVAPAAGEPKDKRSARSRSDRWIRTPHWTWPVVLPCRTTTFRKPKLPWSVLHA